MEWLLLVPITIIVFLLYKIISIIIYNYRISKIEPNFSFKDRLYDWKCGYCGTLNLSMWPGTYKTHCKKCDSYWMDVAMNQED